MKRLEPYGLRVGGQELGITNRCNSPQALADLAMIRGNTVIPKPAPFFNTRSTSTG